MHFFALLGYVLKNLNLLWKKDENYGCRNIVYFTSFIQKWLNFSTF